MMIKSGALVVSVLLAMAHAQRSPYAGSPNRYPQVLPRFQDQQTTTTTEKTLVVDRLGDSGSPNSPSNNVPSAGSAAAAPAATSPPSTTPFKLDLPIDALGYAVQEEAVKTWPEDLRPFWFTNRQQIAAHLNPDKPQNVVQPGVNSRSFFAG